MAKTNFTVSFAPIYQWCQYLEPTVFEKNILPVVYDNKLLVSCVFVPFLIFTMKMRCRHLSAVFICIFYKCLLSVQVSVNIYKDICALAVV